MQDFSRFTLLPPQTALRGRITEAHHRPETECVPPLLGLARLSGDEAARAGALARRLVETLRTKPRAGPVEAMLREYALSSQEGVALMCLAEALLRIPDTPTRDALIRDKIAAGNWRAHAGHSPSLFVNAATWGLVVTGRLTATASEATLSAALTRLIARGGEPLIRAGVDLAMRLLGEQFVTGQTIEEALARSRRMEAKGFRHSYDMLGEAAMTARDAARYLGEYETAIHAIGKAAAGRGVQDGPGISIKLSALHPRYARPKIERVMGELLPRLKSLAVLARLYGIGLNIDAEEADRLDLSLDLLEALCFDSDLAGWDGLGFVVQAYQKRCAFVVDWLIDLAARSGRRLMVRLVKGAYWDSEIKRAQLDGVADFPVFTRKVHTDVSYLACARKLLASGGRVFPQFATHNARTLASVLTMAGPRFHPGLYEFQCLHGMGEPLYEEVVGPGKLGRPCRIYAPVGTHETLLAYLVRRLLENGANSSFVHRLADETVPVGELIADPVTLAESVSPLGAPHPRITAPGDLYAPARRNSAGIDLSNEAALAALGTALRDSADNVWTAAPRGSRAGRAPVRNPADHRDQVGEAACATPEDLAAALEAASAAAPGWAAAPVGERAASLRRAALELQARMGVLTGLLIREAGKSTANAIAEIRETIDFFRYYAAEAERTLDPARTSPLGPVLCVSPWNFPLSIFAGQVAAALAAGNPVLAKPAEETPLIAAEAVRVLHRAGIPPDVLHLLPGDGTVGAALVAESRVQGVIFTGSTEVARLIQRELAKRVGARGKPVPLIAETGGQNAMIVDSSALAEQVVADVIASAFDSAGQRCSALRILCVQEDVAERMLAMLKGAMRELEIGGTDRLSSDIGPVITGEARARLRAHVAAMRARGHRVEELDLPPGTEHGTFFPPTLIEIGRVADVGQEVFGPVLHVLRYRRDQLDRLIAEINATGYGLTFGLHTRIDETIAQVAARIRAGNIYVNRTIIGAVVGVQPFGGSGLSGTGPKAGGPLYLGRLTDPAPEGAVSGPAPDGAGLSLCRTYARWLRSRGLGAEAERCEAALSRSLLGVSVELPGPVGERNTYALHPRGRVAALSATPGGLLAQLGAILATGNGAVVASDHPAVGVLTDLPDAVAERVVIADVRNVPDLGAVLFEGGAEELLTLTARLAAREGPIVPVVAPDELNRLLEERAMSVNTAAAGGNASLMAIG